MLRFSKVTFLFALIFAWAAHAEPVYILIDDSGSMDDRRKQLAATQALTQELEELAAETNVSINLFGGENGGDCSSDIRINDLKPLSTFDRSEVSPSPSGFTPLAAAIGQTLLEVDGTKATIIVIGDAEDSCGVDICTLVPPLLNRQPDVDLRFVLSEPS